MKRFILFQIVIFTCICSAGFAQQQKIIPASPEAASLAKFINYPVSYNTGVPNISIPLYEIKCGTLTLPITLNYHAGGIKVNEQSTWVGLGWNLSAEPEITRVINGVNDFSNAGYIHTYTGDSSAIHSIQNLKDMVNGEVDEDPDEFYYKLNDLSGKFYFHKSLTGIVKPMTMPYRQLGITYTLNNNYIAWQLLDEAGTTYRFGNSLSNTLAIETNNQNDQNTVSSWKCTEMISPSKKDTIFFNYTTPIQRSDFSINEKYVIYDDEKDLGSEVVHDQNIYSGHGIYDVMEQGVHNSVANLDANIYNPVKNPGVTGPDSITLVPASPPREVENAATLMVTNTIKVNEINYRSGKVKFYLHANANMLDSIKVYDVQNQLKKTVVFYYTFWDDTPQVGTKDERTRLDSIAIRGSSAATIEHYSFDYNTSYGARMGMKRSDIRGYFGSNISLNSWFFDTPNAVPEQLVDFKPYRKLIVPEPENLDEPPLVYFAPAEIWHFTIGSTVLTNPGDDYTQAFILKKIHYPTGGYTEFTYESNKIYNMFTSQSETSSGLRIKNIKFFKDNSGTPAFERNYKYGVNESGNGLNMGAEGLDTYNFEQTVYYPPHNISNTYGYVTTQRKRTYNSKSFSTLTFADGTPVVYAEVAEYQSDMGGYTGKTIYNYNYPAEYFPFVNNTPLAFKQTDWEVGQLLSETNYQYDNGHFTWTKKKEKTYLRYNRPEIVYVAKAFANHIVTEDSDHAYPDASADSYQDFMYKNAYLFSGDMLPLKEYEYDREVADSLSIAKKVKTYFYDSPAHIYPTRITDSTSVGDELTQYTTYPQDYASNDAMTASLLSTNKLTYPVEQVTTITHPGFSPLIIGGSVNTYTPEGYKQTEFNLETGSPISLPDFKFSNSSAGQLPQNTSVKQTFLKDSRYVPRNSYDYDDYGHIRQFTTDQNIITSYKWGYKNAYPIAECKNAAYDEFLFEDFEGNGIITSNSITAHSGRSGFSGSISLNSYFSPSLHGKAYILDYFTYNGTNWDYIRTAYTGQTISGLLDDIRIYPKDALISTFTYLPLTGMSSSTDAKGQTMYYEYDNFQRLMTIRDQDGKILKHTDYHYAQ